MQHAMSDRFDTGNFMKASSGLVDCAKLKFPLPPDFVLRRTGNEL
jgi:hypothetical protein